MRRILSLAQLIVPRRTGATIEEALAAHRGFLDAAADGIQLTRAGYLPPAAVRTIAPHLPTMRDLIFAMQRESHARRVLCFREHLTNVGLLRKAKGELTVTAAGTRARSDSSALWIHLALRLVPTRHPFDEIATALILLHVATSASRQPHLDAIAETMTALGWSHGGGKPIARTDVQWIWNDLWAALGNVGLPAGDGVLSRIASDEAILLIRGALLAEDAAADD